MFQGTFFDQQQTNNSSLVGSLDFDDAFKYEMHNSNVSVNLTEMAKPFGKDVNDWLQQKNVQEYISMLETTTQNGSSNTTQNGILESKRGNGGGTWSNNDLLTIEFARWLSVEFSIWCNSKIKELMVQGHTEIHREMDDSEFLMALIKNNVDLTSEQNYQLVALNRPNIKLPQHICHKDLTPTEFGNKYLNLNGYCGKTVNLMLQGLGFIEQKSNNRGKKKWHITNEGNEYLINDMGSDGIHPQICIKYNKVEDLQNLLN